MKVSAYCESVKHLIVSLYDLVVAQNIAEGVESKDQAKESGFFISLSRRGRFLVWRSDTIRLDIYMRSRDGKFPFCIQAREIEGEAMLRNFNLVLHDKTMVLR
ncbi:MAG: hypothetical protein NT135_01230 [Candidatus Berkelbacteria bacterium]|nr:hypothetical protein [Candidatus Berkelbacteria bacterium]